MNIEELKAPQSDCPYCNGTGEEDSGGVHLSGAPATIPCRCLYEDPFYVHVSAYNNVAAQLEDAQGEIRALLVNEQNLRAKADRWDFLADRMLAADFDYGGEGIQALVFEMPDGFSASADAADTVDRARALLEQQK